MGIDLTGGHLVTFMLSELRPVVSRHPRFRDNAGSTLAAFSNLITYNDLSLAITNIRSNGDQLSPDNYMATRMGQAVHAQLQGSPGAFIEWTQESAAEDLEPGIYYFAVAEVAESTKDVKLVLERYRWIEGRMSGASGTVIHLAYNIPASDVSPVDSSVQFRSGGNTLTLLTYTESLVLKRGSTVLTPGTDWWLEVEETHPLVTDAPGGQMDGLAVPPGWVDLALIDQDGYELCQGYDWKLTGETTIQLAPWTPQHTTIKAVGHWKRIPGAGVPVVNRENFLDITIPDGEELVQGQCSYSLSRGDYGSSDIIWVPGSGAVLRNLLEPGDRLRWEIRVRRPQVYVNAKKMAVNSRVIPGLDIAIGDQVEVEDKTAVVVFPNRCETYEVFGSKDSVSFDIEIKSNDLLTTTELANLVHTYLTVEARTRLESAGLTVNRVSSSYQGEAKDASGTTASHKVTLSVSGLGDWEQHIPLINRVDSIDLSGVRALDTYPGHLSVAPRLSAYGINRFLPAYQ